MKLLYMFAGGTDGYVNIHYTLDKQVAERFAADINSGDREGDWSDEDSILVPDDATYESLGINYSIESDMYDEGDEYE